jgi:acetoacetyl-CoA synthetase
MRPIWSPSVERAAATHTHRFSRLVEATHDVLLDAPGSLHRWSVDHLPDFWSLLWDYTAVIGDKGERTLVDADRMPGARFFPEARLNFAENLLRRDDEAPAIIATTEQGRDRTLNFKELRHQALAMAGALRAAGVAPGDRVAGIMANGPEAIVAALGTAAVGAVWSACSPDFGIDGIVDRFGQIEPKVLLTVDGYHYGGKLFECLPKAGAVRDRVPSIEAMVIVPFSDGHAVCS